ncbi:MAG: hypothetical protein P4L26_14375 [Terracidiphilus sp.]|nr:hypothetical protein [Terracidiphilus sp.]
MAANYALNVDPAAPGNSIAVASGEPEEIIPLIPCAAAKLRITAFPQLKS